MKMKKFLCVAVCLLIGVCAIIFGACGDKKGYDLKNFMTDYSNSDFLPNNSYVAFNNGRYEFKLGNLVNDAFKDELLKIETLNNNLSTFIAKNISYSLEKGNDGVAKADANAIKKYLNSTKNYLKNVDNAIQDLDFMTKNANAQNLDNNQKRESLKIFYDSLNAEVYNYFVALSNLSNIYYTVYFNDYLGDINTNYYQLYVGNNIDIGELSNQYLYNARVDYQIFNTTQIYLIENWNKLSIEENFDAYLTEITALNSCNLTVGQKFADTEETKLLAVEMFNSIALLNNGYADFAMARDILLNSQDEDADYDESLVVVKNYKSKVYNFNRVLKELYAKLDTVQEVV